MAILLDINHTYRTIGCAECNTTLQVPISCKNRFCDICHADRRKRIRSKLDSIIQAEKLQPGHRYKMLTLTLPNFEDAGDGAKTLISSFRRLRQRQMWQNKVKGGCYVIEITGSPGSWHVHMHIIVNSTWFSYKKLRTAWSKCSPGRIIHISQIPAKESVRYVTKYMSKSEVASGHQQGLSQALQGVRLFGLFGSWHNLGLLFKLPKYACSCCGSEAIYFIADPDVFHAHVKYGVDVPGIGHDKTRRHRALLRAELCGTSGQ